MQKVEVLISTMNLEKEDFVESMNLKTDAVIINQTKKKPVDKVIQKNGTRIRIVSSSEKGLSKSRNRALEHATGDIGIITDDDVIFEDNYEEKIKETYKKYPDADIIAFQVERIGNAERKKSFREHENWENYLTSMKISSVEITFRIEKIKEQGLMFNPNIGAGTDFSNGEENIFLYDALRKGLKILYVPINIAKVDMSESSWFEGYTKKYFESVGAKFYNMSSTYYWLLIIQFAVRKVNIYKENVSFFEAIQSMKMGVNKYRKRYE